MNCYLEINNRNVLIMNENVSCEMLTSITNNIYQQPKIMNVSCLAQGTRFRGLTQ